MAKNLDADLVIGIFILSILLVIYSRHSFYFYFLNHEILFDYLGHQKKKSFQKQ